MTLRDLVDRGVSAQPERVAPSLRAFFELAFRPLYLAGIAWARVVPCSSASRTRGMLPSYARLRCRTDLATRSAHARDLLNDADGSRED